MNRHPLSRWLAVGASVGVLISGAEAGERTGSEQSLKDVRARVRAYEHAWNSHDARKVAAFYSQDADMVMGNGPWVIGREAIAASWARYFSAISDHRAGTFQVDTLRLLAPDVALVNVSSLTAGRDENNEELPERRARGTWILTVQDGQWVISALRGFPAEGDLRVEPGRDR